MINFTLDPGEYILLQTSDAGLYDSKNELEIEELYLTNKHLILTYEKVTGIFSPNETVVERLPLTTILVSGGRTQVDQVDDEDYGKTLRITFKNGTCKLLELNVAPQKEYPKWLTAISEAVLQCQNGEQEPPPKKVGPEENLHPKREVRFCSYCGTKLDTGARFCKGCGKALEHSEPVGPSSEPIQTKAESNEPFYERETVYEGRLHKCPSCGELLDSFRSHCPACGYEIRDARTSHTVKELALKLEKIEAQTMPHVEEKKSVMKMLVGKDFNDEDEVESARKRFEEHKQKQKATLIINYSVPNTKEDILEFMILASSSIDVKKGIDDEVSKAWIAKLEQVYERATLLMGDTPAFSQIKRVYDKKKAQLKNRKFKGLAIASYITGGYVSIFGFGIYAEEGTLAALIAAMAGIGLLLLGVKFTITYTKNNKENL